MRPKRKGQSYFESIKKDRKVQILAISLVLSILSISTLGIQTGLDLQGGSLIQVKTERPLDAREMNDVTTIMEERINNLFHVRDEKVRPWGDDLILVEIAGVNADEAKKLIGKPGKLEVMVGNITVFTGDGLTRVDIFGKNPSTGLWAVPFAITDEAADAFREAAIKTNFGRVSMFLDRGTALVVSSDINFMSLISESESGGIFIKYSPPGASPFDITFTEAINKGIIRTEPDPAGASLAYEIRSAYGVDASVETIFMGDREVGKYIRLSETREDLGERLDDIKNIIVESLPGATEENIQVFHSNMINNAPIGQSLQQELAAGRSVKSLILETGGGEEAREEARRIEVILRSGALPIKVSIAGSYEVSATLGEKFSKNALLAGVLVILGVSAVVFFRYRRRELVVPVLVTGFSEVILILGFSSLIRHNIDLPSIAGIIAAIGTGFDNQIVILDEVLMERERSIARRMKDAFFIVVGSWMTLMAAMVPLFIIGMAQLKGFAIVTIIGATSGVFITRPAYARLLHYSLKR
jgi:preprotein translocase subunit SecD